MKTFHYSQADLSSSEQWQEWAAGKSWPTGLSTPGTKSNLLICSCQAWRSSPGAREQSSASLILVGTQEKAQQCALRCTAPALSRAIFKSSPDGDRSSLWEKGSPESLISGVAVTKNFPLFVPIHPKNASCCVEGEQKWKVLFRTTKQMWQ